MKARENRVYCDSGQEEGPLPPSGSFFCQPPVISNLLDGRASVGLWFQAHPHQPQHTVAQLFLDRGLQPHPAFNCVAFRRERRASREEI